MKLNELTIHELECMPYDEIAYLVLIESGKKEKLLNLYKKICKLLNLDFQTEQEKITDFFEILSMNKKFVMLENGYWDLQINHKTNLIVEEHAEEDVVDPEELEETEEIIEEHPQEIEEDIFYDGEGTDDTADDDLANLVVISDEEDETR